MNKRVLYFCLFVLSVGLFACKEQTNDFTLDDQYSYFPTTLGKYIIYRADSVLYYSKSGATVRDSVSIQVKEEIGDTISDALGRLGNKLLRYERRTDSDPWTLKDVWFTIRTTTVAERVEENLRFIRMAFPISEWTASWDGNIYIDKDTDLTIVENGDVVENGYENWTYRYTALHKPLTLGALAFDSTLTIVEADYDTEISSRQVSSTYAKGVGLISRSVQLFDTQCNGGQIENCVGLPWSQKVERGILVRLTAIEYN